MWSYLGPPWTDFYQIWAVEVFHHALPIYDIQNAEMQKKVFVTSSLRYSIVDIAHYVSNDTHRGSPHGTLNPHPMRIGDLDSKTTLTPHGFDLVLSCVLCCVTVREIQSCSSMRVVCVLCGAHARPHWIRIGDLESVNPFSVTVWRAPLSPFNIIRT